MLQLKRVLHSVLLMLLLCLGMKSMTAQTPYRQYANDGVELNFFEIQNVDFRAYLLYNLVQDNRFVLIPEEENGILSLSSNDDLSRENFFDTFEDFYNNTYTDFQLLSKQEITDLATMWKSEVDPRLFSAIMMDIIIRKSRSGENEHCIDADPFCTSDFYEFESASTTQTADDLEGEDITIEDGCIGNSYNPSWYYLRIADSGPFTIHMEGHDPENPNILRDIDFCLWGPYTEEQVNSGYACSHLTTNKIIDCNYSTSYLENAYLGYPANQHQHNAGHGTVNYHVPQSGEYYLLMITNFSRQPCLISFNKPDESEAGTTDCSILPPIVNNDGPYCVGETIHLTAMGISGASYNWTRPNGFFNPFNNPSIQPLIHPNYQNPNIANCTMDMAGPYICTISKEGHGSACDTTWVEIYPSPVANFTATTACVGNPTQFDASSSTTDPPGYNIASYEWDFGDGTTGSGVMTSNTYAQAGTYTVTLHVSDAEGHCSDEVIQTIMVVDPNAEDYYVTICEGESYTFNGVTYSQEGDYSITIQTEGCESTATLHLTVIDLDVQIEVIPNDSICEGDTVTLHAYSSYELVAVGDILCTDGIIVKPEHWPCGKTAKGIVFYVDDSHLHGYAVSLTQSGPMKWSTSTNDVQQLPNYSHWRYAIKDFDGLGNTQIIRTGTTPATYPAAWANNVDPAAGWYLPAAGQVNLLFGELVDVNASLTLVGGTPMQDPGNAGVNSGNIYLWSSTEWNANNAMTLKIRDGLVESVKKNTTDNKYYVRSVINF